MDILVGAAWNSSRLMTVKMKCFLIFDEQIRENMEGTFPGRTYSSKLLHRILKKAKTALFRTGPDCMTKFMEYGFQIREEGGIFDLIMDERGPLRSCIFEVKATCFFSKMSHQSPTTNLDLNHAEVC